MLLLRSITPVQTSLRQSVRICTNFDPGFRNRISRLASSVPRQNSSFNTENLLKYA